MTKKKENSTSRVKKPWPTVDAMKQIYEMKLWGGDNAPFYSGDGSHDPAIINPYLTALSSFLKSFESSLVVCDLGCGDFNVGKELVAYTKKYIAVDIVAELIAYNKQQFQDEKLEFKCLDIAKDELPKGDCAILRQVLQHLSNTEVQGVLNKLTAYKYVILTEHIPTGNFIPNKDIISGQGIRLKKQSGLDILALPFGFKTKSQTQLEATNSKDGKGIIKTTLYKL